MAIRVSMGHIDTYDDRVARYARQLGVTGVQLHSPSNLPGDDGYWSVAELAALRDRCAADGLRIDGLENVPAAHFWKVQQGAPVRVEQIENYCKTIRNMASVGLDLLGYNFLAGYVWRSEMRGIGRGGARVTSFDLATAQRDGNALAAYKLAPPVPDDPLTRERLWENYQYFIDAVLPVAEAEGVRLALHPDDPPVDEPLGGCARIFISPASLVEGRRRAGDSPAWGLDLCLGTVSEMGGEPSINEVIDAFGPAGQIHYVHFRDVAGVVPSFTECFLGEGNFRPARVLRRLHERGFDGFVIDDHVPALDGDADTWGDPSAEAYCSAGRAHAIGYLKGLLDGLED
jgi:mannonate dehydratase